MAANGSNSFGIRDNHSRGKVADFLVEKIAGGSHLSVVSAYFTIYAYEALLVQLDQIGQLHFLFGEPRFIASLDQAEPRRGTSKSRMKGWNWRTAFNKKRSRVDVPRGYRTK